MTNLSRRTFLVTAAAAGAAKGIPVTLKSPPARHILTLVYDKSLGMMRAIDRVVN